jgi:hypothetical protein
MSFLQPLLLFGLPLALIPLLIHLLNRLRYRSVKWGAMAFILKANRSSTSMARIRHWLILLARVTAIFALITAIARPMVGGWLGWKLSGEPDTVIILLDRSASMGAEFAPGKSKLRQAVNMISESGTEIASEAHIILIDSASLKVHEIPSWDIFKNIEDSKITQTSADIPSMYRAAVDYMTENQTGTTEIWTLSDMQKSNWNPDNTEWSELDTKFSSLPQPVTFRLLAVDSENNNNRSISLIKLSTYPGKDGKTIREIAFNITNSSDLNVKSEIPLQLSKNGLKQQLTLQINGGSTRLRHIFANSPPDKTLYGYIALPPDSNIEDNTVFFGFAPKIEEKSIVISDNSKSAILLGVASAPEGAAGQQHSASIRESELPNTNLNNVSLVICQIDPNKTTLIRLRSFAQQGGTVLFLPPLRTKNAPDSIWQMTKDLKNENGVIVAEWNHQDGPLSDTVSGEELPVDTIKLKKRTLLKKSEAMISALCSDGKPFLYAEKPGKGMIYYCTTLPLDTWSNLGDGIIIVPMLRRLVREGSRRLLNVSQGVCGLHSYQSENGKYTPILTDRKTETDASPEYNTGIFSKGSKITVINRDSKEERIQKISDKKVKTLFTENRIHLFREKGKTSGKMQSGIWRIFLIAVMCALILEGFLSAPFPSVKSRE